jgi:hypothetical protein
VIEAVRTVEIRLTVAEPNNTQMQLIKEYWLPQNRLRYPRQAILTLLFRD